MKNLERRIKKKTRQQLPVSHPMRPLPLITEESLEKLELESIDESVEE